MYSKALTITLLYDNVALSSQCLGSFVKKGEFFVKGRLVMGIFKFVRLCVQRFEERICLSSAVLPSAPVLPPALVSVMETPMPVQDILPGATNVPIAKFQVTDLTHASMRLSELFLVPAAKSQALNQNIQQLALEQVVGKTKTIVGYASPDWNTDVVDFQLFNPAWTTPQAPACFEIDVTRFYGFLSGPKIGAFIAEADFRDIRNNLIPDSQVQYAGVPVLHTMENHMLGFYQTPMVSETATVHAGQKSVTLAQFYVFSNTDISGDLVFSASQGSLQNAENYYLVATTWDGLQQYSIKGVLKGTTVTFSYHVPGNQNSLILSVKADIKAGANTAYDPRLKVYLSGITATDLSTKKMLAGLMLNGIGAGQLQMGLDPKYATSYSIVA